MPFFDGNDDDVIPVYAPSNLFESYFTQAFQILKDRGFDYWFVVADDAIINPQINERNLANKLCLSVNDNFIPEINPFCKGVTWDHAWNALAYEPRTRYVDTLSMLPEYQQAHEKLKNLDLLPEGLIFENVYWNRWNGDDLAAAAFYGFSFLCHREYKSHDSVLMPKYPLVWGFSDVFCVGSKNIKEFCRLCGLFGASGLFVEIAIPTALVLSCGENIIREHQIEYQSKVIWGKERETAYMEFDYRLDLLMNNFPANQLFIHPIKLSKWILE